MLISNAKKDEANEWNFDIKISDSEVGYLVNLGIQFLIEGGVVNLLEQEEEQQIELPATTHESSGTLN